MAPGENGSYNVHTGMAGFGSAISVSEIDELETINAADGQITFGGASLVDVDKLNAKTVNATTVTADRATITDVTATNVRATTMDSDDATFGSVITGTLFSTVSNLGLATMNTATINTLTSTLGRIDTLTSSVATITDLTVTTLHMELLRLKNLVVDNLAEFKNIVVNGLAQINGNAIVTGNIIANNIVADRPQVRTDADGLWRWEHGRTLNSPVMYYASVAEDLISKNPYPLPYEVTLFDASPSSVTILVWERVPFFVNNSPIRNKVLNLNLLAIGN
jgi:hypothetical protein